MVISRDLLTYLAEYAVREPEPALLPLIEEFKKTYPNLRAILFYGSCLQEKDLTRSLVDLYLLTKDYRGAYRNPALALANYLLPPNVFWASRDRIRAKYAVMALWHLEKAVTPRWFHSYFWGRFAQPTALIWWKDSLSRQRALRILAQAVVTFLQETIPLAPPQGRIKDLWLTGLTYSYRAELRPESPKRLWELWEKNKDFFKEVTQRAVPALPFAINLQEDRYVAKIPAKLRKLAQVKWSLRMAQGKVLSVLRLAKACFTFQGGVDYALWKIERHSGKRLEVPAALRRHPFLALIFWGWRALLTRGVR